MERINLTLPISYKEIFQSLADSEGISMSELLRQWIKENNSTKIVKPSRKKQEV
jgi:hypothetical protein